MNYTYNLGETLHSFIQKSGYSTYEISKKANISRSMLQKVLSNERKLTKNYLDKLTPFLKVSPKEYMELVRMMEEIQKGTFDYRSYQLIKDLLIHLTETSEIYKDFGTFSTVVPNKLEKKEIYKGRQAVVALLHERLLREYEKAAPQMSAFIPGNSDLVSEVLAKESLTSPDSKRLNIKQIISLARDKSVAETVWMNVNALVNVLPNIVTEKCHYEVCYYYGKDFSDVKGEFAFPYYIVFSDSVMLLSMDCTTAVTYEEETLHQYFFNMFQSFLANTMPLVTSCVKVNNILGHFMELDKLGGAIYTLESQPCLIEYLSKDMVIKYARKAIPSYDAAVEAILCRCKQLKNYKQHKHTCYFSKTGLLELTKTGYIVDFPKDYVAPLDEADRRILLEALYEEIHTGRQNHRMMNPHTFPIPNDLICVLHQDSGLDFYGFGLDDKNLNYIFITEPSVLDLFYGFFQYLKNSMLICTKEETLECIRECIQQLS